jgi:hypothetical protein
MNEEMRAKIEELIPIMLGRGKNILPGAGMAR